MIPRFNKPIQEKIRNTALPYIKRLQKQWRLVIVALATVPYAMAYILFASFLLVAPSRQFVLPGDTAPTNAEKFKVGLVLGAGIRPDGKPYKELQDRLDTAAAALQSGQVQKLILSGDNRFAHYNEPEAMMRYLTEVKGMPADRLQPDYAGRSTYESCERAAKVFKQERLLIISAGSHLPRAIYTCRHFGIEAYGLAGTVEANNSRRRELLARAKAVFNVHFIGEQTILGTTIDL